MKLIARCFLFALMGGLLCTGTGLSFPVAAEQSPADEENRNFPSTVFSEKERSGLWGQALDARQHWSRAAGEGDAPEVRKWAQRYVEILKNAAEQGDVRGMVELGKIFSLGTDFFPANKDTAREWFEKAASAGDADSLYHLGFLEEHASSPDRKIADQRYKKAFDLFNKKAEEGDARAVFWVGLMYRKGQGVEKSLEKAYQWLTRSAQKGNLQAQILVAFMSREGEGCDISDSESLKWFEKAAEKGDVGAMMETALAYSQGRGGKRNEVRAREWLEKAGRMSDPFALRLLAEMHENGRGGDKDELQALAYYRQAASLGEGWSALKVYEMWKEGKGGEVDEKSALVVLNRAANEFNFPPAVFELGVHERNVGDREKGNALIEKAAKQGFVPAMRLLGKLYLFSFFEQGISWNPLVGCWWLDLASERGDQDARLLLYCSVGGAVVLLAIIIGAFLWKMNKVIKRRQAVMDEEEANQKNSSST